MPRIFALVLATMHTLQSIIRWLCLTGLLSLAGCQPDSRRPDSVRLKIGDQPTWAASTWNDQDWQTTNGTAHQGLFWLRFHIQIDSTLANDKPLGLKISALGSFDAFWDGQLIGHNGQVGPTKATERPGQHTTYWLLPDAGGKPGLHVLALRVSNFYAHADYSFYNCRMGGYPHLVKASVPAVAGMALLAGAFLIGAFYYLLLSLYNRQEPLFRLFSLLCGLFFCLIVAEYVPLIWSYPYSIQTPRLEVIGVLTLSIALLVPSFLNRQFALFNPKRFTLLLLLLLVGIYVHFHGRYDFTAQLMSLTMGVSAFFLALLALAQKRQGAVPILVSVILSGLLACLLYYDYSLFLSFGVLLLAMLYELVMRSRAIDRAYQQSVLVSERLKTELLKKWIQPHFLLNTLTSLVDWVEESPKQGVQFIEALAGEFNLLNQMVDTRLVTITQEIQLCKHHLTVMSFRKQIQYIWTDHDVDPTDTLPPALLHTILENGITHSLPLTDGTVRFSLSCVRTDTYRQYQVHTLAINRTNPDPPNPGTGIAYLKARLTESYASGWTLVSEESDEGWLTTITIYEDSDH